MNAPLILLVEDDTSIREALHGFLRGQGYRVAEAVSLSEGLRRLGQAPPDLLVLDLGLPDGDGGQLLKQLRLWSRLPVLILSARDQEADKIAALDAGADDYLSKPFTLGELGARCRALLRRSLRESQDSHVQLGPVCVDLERRQVLRDGVEIHLTPLEFRLLRVLAERAGRVVTQRQLLREVWGEARADNTHYVRIYVAHLRHKLEADPAQPRFLLTETGVGYRLVPDDLNAKSGEIHEY